MHSTAPRPYCRMPMACIRSPYPAKRGPDERYANLSGDIAYPKSQKMITGELFAQMALSFPGTEQAPHFERVGFKVSGRRMFATYLQKDNTANIFLTPDEQAVFCKMEEDIYPIPTNCAENAPHT